MPYQKIVTTTTNIKTRNIVQTSININLVLQAIF